MTNYNYGSPSGNVLIPITNFMKTTKELDIASAVATDLTSGVIRRAVAIFYADSSGNWRMRFNINVVGSESSCTGTTTTITGIAVKVITNGKHNVNYIATPSSGAVLPCASYFYAETGVNGTRFFSEHASITCVEYHAYGDIELAAEPTAFTIAANMENPGAVSAYIPPASATSAGLLSYYNTDITTLAAANWAFSTPTGNMAGRISRVANVVTLSLPEVASKGTSSGSVAYVSCSASLPSWAAPTENIFFYVPTVSNNENVAVPGSLMVLANGSMRLYYSADLSTSWPAAGNSYVLATSVSWAKTP
jgi:hypothetical protein